MNHLRDPASLLGPNAREDRLPAKAELLKDCVSACRQLASSWDLEVEAIVILVPKHSNQYAHARTIQGNDKEMRILQAIIAELPTMGKVDGR